MRTFKEIRQNPAALMFECLTKGKKLREKIEGDHKRVTYVVRHRKISFLIDRQTNKYKLA